MICIDRVNYSLKDLLKTRLERVEKYFLGLVAIGSFMNRIVADEIEIRYKKKSGLLNASASGVIFKTPLDVSFIDCIILRVLRGWRNW